MAANFDCIGVVSKDMQKSVNFYRQLGINLPDPDSDHIEATLPNGMRFMLDSLELIKSLGWWEEPVGQRMGIGVRLDSPDEVNTLFAELVAQGYKGKTEPFDAFWGQRYAQIMDPDDNAVDLYCAL